MPVAVVVGVQWGDEGKGKVVDYLTESADLVVRFQGGNNAGHTLVVEGRKTALQLIPSGILRPGTRCLLASGVVVDPESLFGEFERLQSIGVNVSPERFGIAREVQLILPYHRALDRERERKLGCGNIGTTGKGIGPAYEDAVSRQGIRVCDLFNESVLAGLVQRNVEQKNQILRAVLNSELQFDAGEILAFLKTVSVRLRPYMVDVSGEVGRAIAQRHVIVFEGAQGSLLDINHGTYPYVTSSNTVAGYACVSAGIGPKHIETVIGICKAYCTRVGNGPFPTEDLGEVGERLRKIGAEFGTVTGRPRRCGWFDAAAVRRAIRLNGIDSLVITKLDVLSGLSEVKLGVAYRLNGEQLEELSVSGHELDNIEVLYETLPGWDEDLSQVRKLEDLPINARRLISRIEELTGCEVGVISVGPGREQTIIISNRFADFASSPKR